MSSGPKSVTSTTETRLPPELEGVVGDATNAVQDRYLRTTGYAGRRADGYNNLNAGSLNANAENLVQDQLQGKYLTPGANPFLEQTFNRAADLTRTRLSSEFAGQGRNIGASLPARSEELQTLASNIYGQNYQAERDRQQNALVQAQNYDPLNQLINRIAALVPNAGGITTATQPVYRTGLF